MPIEPVPIPAGPPVPDSSVAEPAFDAQFEASLAWQRNELAPKANALATTTYANTVEAVASAEISASRAVAANASAVAAATARTGSEDARDAAQAFAAAAGAAAGLPALAGHGGHIMRANSAETGVEWFDPDTSAIVAVAALNIDCSLGGYFTKTIAGNSTFTFSNAPAGLAYAFTLEITHTSGTVAWPASVRWPNGAAPALTTGKVHLFMFLTDDGGATWRAASCVNYAS